MEEKVEYGRNGEMTYMKNMTYHKVLQSSKCLTYELCVLYIFIPHNFPFCNVNSNLCCWCTKIIYFLCVTGSLLYLCSILFDKFMTTMFSLRLTPALVHFQQGCKLDEDSKDTEIFYKFCKSWNKEYVEGFISQLIMLLTYLNLG